MNNIHILITYYDFSTQNAEISFRLKHDGYVQFYLLAWFPEDYFGKRLDRGNHALN